MTGLVRLLFAGGGCGLRWFAGLLIGPGALLVRGAAACERRARPPRAGAPPPPA